MVIIYVPWQPGYFHQCVKLAGIVCVQGLKWWGRHCAESVIYFDVVERTCRRAIVIKCRAWGFDEKRVATLWYLLGGELKFVRLMQWLLWEENVIAFSTPSTLLVFGAQHRPPCASTAYECKHIPRSLPPPVSGHRQFTVYRLQKKLN